MENKTIKKYRIILVIGVVAMFYCMLPKSVHFKVCQNQYVDEKINQLVRYPNEYTIISVDYLGNDYTKITYK